MHRFLFIFSASLLQAASVFAESRQITLFKDSNFDKGEITVTYSDECFELDKLDEEWAHQASSVDTLGHCVTLFSKAGCTGDYVHLYPGRHSLPDLDFDDKAVSFERCDSSQRFAPGVRPIYHMNVKHFYPRNNWWYRMIPHRSGCQNLNNAWLSERVGDIDTWSHCIAVYPENENCEGEFTYILPGSPKPEFFDFSFKHHYLDSFKTCDLYYQTSCTSCPKQIAKGSKEYEFWVHLFSIYSDEYRRTFEERVEQNPNGQISWDFLFPNQTVATKLGDQYEDALYMNRDLLERLRFTRVGYLNFNAVNVDALIILVRQVIREKKKQSANFRENWNDHEFVIHRQYLTIWQQILERLEVLYEKWDYPESRDCGQPMVNVKVEPLINEGKFALKGNDPWNVAIYSYRRSKANTDPVLICGGTLVSPQMVISAAHCFYDTTVGKPADNTSQYEIYVGKYTRTYSKTDSDLQKVHKIKELVFNPKTYNPDAADHYGSDIILIILKNPVMVNKYVRPVCLDWEDLFYGASLTGTMGRIVGWGINENLTVGNELLLTADLPYISYKDCVGKIKHVTLDKFCGGYSSGQGARKGDSGAGYVFEKDGRYYLRGIVSTRDKATTSSFSTFTDVSMYLDWIRNHF